MTKEKSIAGAELLALRELVETILEGESGHEIDAGCDGNGPLAAAMVILGMAKDNEEATNLIFGMDQYDGEDEEDDE